MGFLNSKPTITTLNIILCVVRPDSQEVRPATGTPNTNPIGVFHVLVLHDHNVLQGAGQRKRKDVKVWASRSATRHRECEWVRLISLLLRLTPRTAPYPPPHVGYLIHLYVLSGTPMCPLTAGCSCASVSLMQQCGYCATPCARLINAS
jgi:hypothetical protein